VYRADKKACEAIHLDGIWVGLIDELSEDEFTTTTIHLNKGDLLVLYTDGVFEAENNTGEQWGFENLTDSIVRHAGKPLHELRSSVLSELDTFCQEREQLDDVTILIVRGES
jgi:serine phosphatase RsbU (regulator of sigma subunit)